MAANRHTHNFRKCIHASVGLAQAHPNNVGTGIVMPDQAMVRSLFQLTCYLRLSCMCVFLFPH